MAILVIHTLSSEIPEQLLRNVLHILRTLFFANSAKRLKIFNVSYPIPVTARSKASVCGRSLAGIGGSNPAVDTDACLL